MHFYIIIKSQLIFSYILNRDIKLIYTNLFYE